MKYELVEAQDCFDDNNNGYIYGIHWIDGVDVVDCEWFKTEEERYNAISEDDKPYMREEM